MNYTFHNISTDEALQTVGSISSTITDPSVSTAQTAGSGITNLVLYFLDAIAKRAFTYTENPTLFQIVVYLLAIVGLAAVIFGSFNYVFKAIKILFMVFIALPLVIVLSLSNKKKRAERLKSWQNVKEGLKGKGKVPRRHWILWLAWRILLPLVLVGAYIYLNIWGFG